MVLNQKLNFYDNFIINNIVSISLVENPFPRTK